MTQTFLGNWGKWFTEASYALLLVALLSVYIIVGSSWTRDFLEFSTNYQLTTPLSQIIFALAIAGIIYKGFSELAFVNYIVTSLMLGAILLVMVYAQDDIVFKHLEPQKLDLKDNFSPLPMLLTTLGFSIIFPSLATYLKSKKSDLVKSLLGGSLLILTIYILWQATAFGVIGEDLKTLAQSSNQGDEIIHYLSDLSHSPVVTNVGYAFMFFATLSSILGVGQCMYAFIKDALPINCYKTKSRISIVSSFLIPLIIIQIYPTGITKILSLGGIFVAILLGLIPTLMVISKTYTSKVAPLKPRQRIFTTLSLAFFITVILIQLSSYL